MSINGHHTMTTYQHAAEQGVAQAQFELGLRYSTGHGVDSDLVSAHKWFNIAALQGVTEARIHRADLAQEMTPDEVSEAQRQAREWLTCH